MSDEQITLRLADVEALLKASADACREQPRFGRRASWFIPLVAARVRVRMCLPATSGYFGSIVGLGANEHLLDTAERVEGERCAAPLSVPPTAQKEKP